jgi:hypothetical protein
VFYFEDVESHDSNLEGRLGLMRIKLEIVIRRAKKVIIYLVKSSLQGLHSSVERIHQF